MDKLYRSRNDVWIAGVCGGLGRYLGIDPTIVRLFFVLLFFAGGSGLLIYLLMMLLMPRAPEGEELPHAVVPLGENPQAALIVGVVLIVFGGFFFLGNLDIQWLHWMRMGNLWPLLLVIAGGVLLWQSTHKEA
ncbi:MAG: PspC domain-containing protein [Anaerolineales bacterium]|nr:PspC domain-containing protein [Anaerolineales bacterium]